MDAKITSTGRRRVSLKNVIVTGASGFIGNELISELNQEYRVIAVGRKFKNENKLDNVQYLVGDLNQLTSSDIAPVLNKDSADIFIHAAGQAHIAQTDETREFFFNNNVKATESALRMAYELKVSKFICISSAIVYNNNPTDFYETSKREAEDLVVRFCNQNNINYIIIRPVIVYGINEPSGYFQALIQKNQKGFLLMPYSGRKTQHLIYVKNLCFIIRTVLEEETYNNSILLARDQEEYTYREVCALIQRIVGSNPVHIPVQSIFIKGIIVAINIIKMFGVLKGIRARSIKNLNKEISYPISDKNEKLIGKLPFSADEALSAMVRSMKH